MTVPSPPPRRPPLTLGRRGEEAAACWYAAAGYRVLARNWRRPQGEIDLVAQQPGGPVVFCEVKTRSSVRYGTPREAVTPAKRHRLRRLAAQWLSEQRRRHGQLVAVRFDVVAVRAGPRGTLVLDVLHDAF